MFFSSKLSIFLLFFISVAFGLLNYSDSTLSASLIVNSLENVEITNFFISNSNLTQSDFATFNIEVLNVGNLAQNITVFIDIFYLQSNSQNFVQKLDLGDFLIGPGEYLYLTKLFDSDSNTPGQYIAIANVVYNQTKQKNLTFFIFQKPSLPSSSSPSSFPAFSGGGGGGFGPISAEEKEKLKQTLSSQRLASAALSIKSYAVYSESFPGEKLFLLTNLKNNLNKPIFLNLNFYSDTFASSNIKNMLINPSEESSIPIEVEVPINLKPGLYLSFLNGSTMENESFTIPVLISVLNPSYMVQPVVLKRTIIQEKIANQTLSRVFLSIQNNKEVPISFLEISEFFPKELLELYSPAYSSHSPDSIDYSSNMLKWKILDLLPKENRKISYSFSSPFNLDYLFGIKASQITSVQSQKKLMVSFLKIPQITSENGGWITLEVFNPKLSISNYEIFIDGPSDWSVVPKKIVGTISPREKKQISFFVESLSPNSKVGNFILSVKSDDGLEQKSFYVPLTTNFLIEQLPFTSEQSYLQSIMFWATKNLLIIFLIFLAVSILLFVMRYVVSYYEGRAFINKEELQNQFNQLKQIFKNQKI